jgi:predicted nuclease of predicted toxin-antitoxin system
VTIWLDNHLSPALAAWIESDFGEPCVQVRDVGLASAADKVIFDAARAAASVFITKDRDFAELVTRLGHHLRSFSYRVEIRATPICELCCVISWRQR